MEYNCYGYAGVGHRVLGTDLSESATCLGNIRFPYPCTNPPWPAYRLGGLDSIMV